MPTYKMVDTDQLEADLTTVADKIRAKGGTSEKMTFPAGFASAVESISTGVEVREATGTFTLQSGQRTVSCGFAPDVVMIHINDSEDSEYYTCAVNFAADTRSKTLTAALFISDGVDVYDVDLYDIYLTQTPTGFTLEALGKTDYGSTVYPPETFYYSAVKYTA